MNPKKISIHIPRGFAHGFQTLEKSTELIYFHSESYSPENDLGVNPLDPTLQIKWPEKISEMS